jgi:hypothetical protein
MSALTGSGYGNDQTATGSDPTAAAIAQIFSTGVTAYFDSQAIQRGYQINNPQYFQSGYLAGQAVPYASQPMGQPGALVPGAAASSSTSTLILLVLAGVILYAVLKK